MDFVNKAVDFLMSFKLVVAVVVAFFCCCCYCCCCQHHANDLALFRV